MKRDKEGKGSSGGSDGKESAWIAGAWIPSLGWEDPLEREMAIHSSYFGLENSMERRACLVTVHGVAKSWT